MRALLLMMLLALASACGGQTRAAGADNGNATAGSIASGGSGASGGGTPSGGGTASGGIGPVLNAGRTCVERPGPPSPRVEQLHPPPLLLACQGTGRVDLLRIANDSGRGLEWSAQVLPDEAVFTPSRRGDAACEGEDFRTAAVEAHAPPGVTPDQTLSGTLRLTTNYDPLRIIDADVSAVIVKSAFSLDPTVVDFGSVVAGSTASVSVTVHNLGSTPLDVLEPTSPVAAPFLFRDWVKHGEDCCSPEPIPPGGSAVVTLSFSPSATGELSAKLELSPFGGPVDASCGALQTLELHGSAMPP